MPSKNTYQLILVFVVTSSFVFSQNKTGIAPKLLTSQTIFQAGDSITLKFSSDYKQGAMLYCSNSYGSTIVSPTINKSVLSYEIPMNLSKKRGAIVWTLLDKNKPISGQLKIEPQLSVSKIESYLGPPSIEAGGTDYTMLTVIPTDALDNPLKDSTLVTIKHQFLEKALNKEVTVKNLIAYKNINSSKKSGRIIIASEALGMNSKEYDVNVMAGMPTNFKISATRHHDYADGNQITTFSTSKIEDKNGNTIADGTQVEFFITTQKGYILKTSGNTIKGIATAKMIHPNHESQWRIKAYINGISESTSINLKYKPVLSHFEVNFSEDHRTITIGPLKSFMNQFIPNGLRVTVGIYKDDLLVNEIVTYSNEGHATALLRKDIYSDGDYTIKVKTAGIERVFKTKKLK